jgi:hypothetical protein
LASIYNVTGGLAIIFLLDVLAPLVSFEPLGNMLFRLFVGGTAVTFGLAYFHLAQSSTYRAPILFFGTGLKYWAFVAALLSYLFYGLSFSMLFLFGVANLCFALLFTFIIFAKSSDAQY